MRAITELTQFLTQFEHAEKLKQTPQHPPPPTSQQQQQRQQRQTKQQEKESSPQKSQHEGSPPPDRENAQNSDEDNSEEITHVCSVAETNFRFLGRFTELFCQLKVQIWSNFKTKS